MKDGYKKTETIINEYREAAALTRQIIPVIKQFDNKCFNKRLQNAIQEKTKSRVYCGKRYTIFEIYIYNSSYNQITICNIKQADAFTDGKRINAAAIIEGLNEKYQDLLKRAYDLENELQQVELYAAALESLKNQIEKITSNISYQIRDNFDLNYRVTKH